MLGPSGSGKTTTLRMIAGFEQPTAGRILLHGEDVTVVPRSIVTSTPSSRTTRSSRTCPWARTWPTAWSFRKVAGDERIRRVDEALRMVRLDGHDQRKPAQLSGGQRQRVALARALVNRPRVLLLDEPLGALDLKLREEMQIELKAIQQQVGITFIYVTHDQEEALTMSDRLAVFNNGRIEQLGTPAEVYERPATRFVAGFVGTSNLLSGEVAQSIPGAARHVHDPPGEDPPGRARRTGRRRRDRRPGADLLGRLPRPRYALHRRAGGGGPARGDATEPGDDLDEALAQQGKAVRLIWKRRHELPSRTETQPPWRRKRT